MYKALIIIFFLSLESKAQIQFWLRDDLVEKQLQAGRKAMKIKTAYKYITSENWKVTDSSDYQEIFEYDTAGRKTVHKEYRTDWSKNIKYFIRIDSFFYNEKGEFSGMKRYAPSADKKYYSLEYMAKAVPDSKGKTARINYYGGYGASELTEYHAYTYSATNVLLSISAHNADKTKTYEWKFTYDPKGGVTKVRATSFFAGKADSFNDYIIKYNKHGMLETYTELFNGKTKENESSFLYDDKNRMVQRNYFTSHNFTDTIGYWYNDIQPIYYRSYEKYNREKGHESPFAHEFRVYKYEGDFEF
jgi:hypothetical protein